jgi:hypothetical protein
MTTINTTVLDATAPGLTAPDAARLAPAKVEPHRPTHRRIIRRRGPVAVRGTASTS